MNRVRNVELIALAVLAAACSSGDPLDPTPEDPRLSADVAGVVADGVGEDVQTMRELSMGLHLGGLFLRGTLAPGCPYIAETGWHDCEPVTLLNGLTIDRQYAFFNPAGDPMQFYDPDQTASIQAQRTVDGEIERETEYGTVSGSVHHERDLTVSGLQGDEQKRTWNGTGSSEITRTQVSDERGTRSYELNTEVLVDDVEVPTWNNSDLDPWPLSGSITIHVQGTLTRNDQTRSFERTVVITFDGTQFATATVTGLNGTETFTIDLAQRHARRNH